MDFGMTGPALVLGLSSVGSAVGCSIAWMTCHGVMSRVEDNHGKFIIMASMPASQILYAFVMMLMLKNALLAGKIGAASSMAIGVAVGAAILFSSIYQGMCAATAIQATAKQPAVFARSIAGIVIVESISLFAFVFGYLLI